MEPQWWQPIVQVGVAGGVLVWFMWRNEPRLRGIEASIDRLAKAVLINTLALPHVLDVTKDQVKILINEIDKKPQQ